MKNNRKIEVGQVRCLSSFHFIPDYVEDVYAITSINLSNNQVHVTYLESGGRYTYSVEQVRKDIVVM